jgi:hypothetical protein
MNEIRAIWFALGFFDGKLFHKSICHGLNPGGMGWSALHHAEELLPCCHICTHTRFCLSMHECYSISMHKGVITGGTFGR